MTVKSKVMVNKDYQGVFFDCYHVAYTGIVLFVRHLRGMLRTRDRVYGMVKLNAKLVT